jgi:hypothetical protein
MSMLSIIAIVAASLFAYSVVGVWASRLSERRQRNWALEEWGCTNPCSHCGFCSSSHMDGVCIKHVLAGMFWPFAGLGVLLGKTGSACGALVVGTANLPGRIAALAKPETPKALPQPRISIPEGAALTSEDYRRLAPMVRQFEQDLPIHERE